MEDESVWYKDAIIYEVHVKSFYDSSSDGMGDFPGLTKKLDYLQDLGITAIWLLPFFPSPLRDDGYDISDYKNVHPNYGTLSDFKHFLREAHKRNLKVIIELIINHTSDQHPWFQRARTSKKKSNYRDYYVWSDNAEKYKLARIIFKDFETSNWTWDPIAQAYYWHRFYSHQPDLNYENPNVQQEIFKILDFWLKLGVDGFRLDAVPYLYEKDDTVCENLPETHEFLKKLRTHIDTHYKNRMLIAEANQWPEDAAKYFGDGDECHMAFHFPIMPRLFMAINLEDSLPIFEIATQTPSIPDQCQWALFLRNHDELTLEMVTDEERDYMFRMYAKDTRARVNLGIRRRLAPLLKNDRRKIELMNSLLFSLVGTPVLYYGDEIGMGDNIYLGDRDGVRTPMQWNADRNAGFSKVNPQKLYLPPIIDPEYHYEVTNVETQQNNPFSLYYWTKHMISLRKRHKAFGRGSTLFLKTDNSKILCFIRKLGEEELLIIANLSRTIEYTHLDLSQYKDCFLIELFSGTNFPKIGDLPFFLTMSPYSYYWFSITSLEKSHIGAVTDHGLEKTPLLTFLGPEEKLFTSLMSKSLNLHLYHYLSYSDILKRKVKIEEVSVIDYVTFYSGQSKSYIVLIQVNYNETEGEKYFLHLEFLNKNQVMSQPEKVISRWYDQDKNEKYLCDISYERKTAVVLIEYFLRNSRLKTRHGEIVRSFLQPNLFNTELHEPFNQRTYHHNLEVSYKDFVTRVFIPIDEGFNIDIEIRKFLSLSTRFQSFLKLIGYFEYKNPKIPTIALAEVIKTEEHGHNAYDYAIQEAMHFFEHLYTNGQASTQLIELPKKTLVELTQDPSLINVEKAIGSFFEVVNLLGDMTSDLHFAMASSSDDPNFTPEIFTSFYQRSLYQSLRKKNFKFFGKLNKLKTSCTNEQIEKTLTLEKDFLKYFENFLKLKINLKKIRIHGNFCLEHLFYTGKEFLIADFEANVDLPFNERRFKRCVLHDIAAMIFSFFDIGLEALHKQEELGFVTQQTKTHLLEISFKWSTWVSVIFLKTYLEKVNNSLFVPTDEKITDTLLGYFLIELFLEKTLDSTQTHFEFLDYVLKNISYWFSVYSEFDSDKKAS